MSQWSSDDQRDHSTRRFGPVLCQCCDEFLSAVEPKLLKKKKHARFNRWGVLYLISTSNYHPTLQGLRDAVKLGCQLCILIMHEMRPILDIFNKKFCASDDSTLPWRSDWLISFYKSSPGYQIHLNTIPYPPHIRVQIYGNLVSHFSYPGTSERRSIRRELNSMKKHHGSGYTPPESTDSPVAWELCRTWINNCIENHNKCKNFRTESPDPSKLPTRLLYIASLGHENLSEGHLNSLNIQLHLKQEKQFRGPYMTLSHCWGDSRGILKLTNKNYKKWTETGFPYRDLPKTFKDAVRLALFLGNNYLWIDSLCIIQRPDHPVVNDPSDPAAVMAMMDAKTDIEIANDDWIRESNTMADVYRYSKCNIAATASRGPTEGCFYPRQYGTATVSPLEIRLNDERFLFVAYGLLGGYVDDAPLNERAWVLQERILAPRQINCNRNQLSWECHESDACETFPFTYEATVDFDEGLVYREICGIDLMLSEVEYLFSRARRGVFHGCRFCDDIIREYQLANDTYWMAKIMRRKERLIGATRNEWIAHIKVHLFMAWQSLIKEYSRRALSHRSDKLVAINGIASRMQVVLQDSDEYAAGLWRSQMHWQLLWCKSSIQDKDSRPVDTTDTSPRYDIGPSWSWASMNTPIYWDYRSPIHHESFIPIIDILEMYDGHTITKGDSISSVKESRLTVRCLLYRVHSYKQRRVNREEFFITIGGFIVTLQPRNLKMDAEEDHKTLGQLLMATSYEEVMIWKILYGLILSPCEGRPGYYRRIGQFACHLLKRDKSLDAFRALKRAAEGEKETITLI
ncbi:hypothetical protein F5B19DRAFT_84550 [Rostrohypoxylon terebratum]|nr:hypothetical protein F5B19DRAFT_84550 [Rostrohypoxylon terebratum]